jgi:hypothetical protein
MTTIKENIYTNGQYQVDEEFGEYHILYYPVGPARPHLPVKYRLSSRYSLNSAIKSTDFRVVRDELEPQDRPCLSDLEYNEMYALGLVPWHSYLRRHTAGYRNQ